MFPKRNFKNPKQNQQQHQQHHRHHHHPYDQQQQHRQHNILLQQDQQQQSTTKKEINSGRIGERLIIRTTSLTGQRLRYTITRAFQLAESQPYHSEHHSKCRSYRTTQRNFIKNQKTTNTLTNRAVQSTSSVNDLVVIFFSDKKNEYIINEKFCRKY